MSEYDPLYPNSSYEMIDMNRSPIYLDSHDQKWYFWDEVWSHNYGPFDSYEQAQRELIRYATLELGYDEELENPEDYKGRIDSRSD